MTLVTTVKTFESLSFLKEVHFAKAAFDQTSTVKTVILLLLQFSLK